MNSPARPKPVREAALDVLLDVMTKGLSLSRVLPAAQQTVAERDRALLQELCFGVLRWYERLSRVTDSLMDKPLKQRDGDIRLLIVLGLYQLEFTGIAAHAVLQETVAVTKKRRKDWARGLVNAVLRRYQREAAESEKVWSDGWRAQYSLPDWLLSQFKADWPGQWQAIATAANARPPMTLRVNRAQCSRDDYLAQLQEAGLAAEAHPLVPGAVVLAHPAPVGSLPGFAQGLCSVQDAGAQLAAQILAPRDGDRVLDACAAPGGKSCHLLEIAPQAQLLALDNDESRCQRIHENLDRIGLQAQVRCADAAQPEQWWDGQLFDRILLDVPCSALGVIRRHPDIRHLRKAADLPALAVLQQQILQAAWRTLKPGGRLLYATCSVTRQENSAQVGQFLQSHADARRITIEADWGVADGAGRQILPGQAGMDGFFYALLEKAT
ncbi:16S rRNA (cytosine(967)-C(5))-methyltransferase RsmB [Granulosicoccaceae sp. 1_MG-2023]|nr:16S rRNA (cytosine(967)-C(5))-methyltransferase RsmB [Granulosicoccaceae sp. 1_MG-2023]